MFDNFLLTELLFSIVWIIGILVLREFIISKDGILRKIMIGYFCVEVFTYLSSGLYFCALHYHWMNMSIDVFRLIVIVPKVGIKLILLYYLRVGKYREKAVNSK